jgi:phosphoribosylglycinamide formyltransferase-1
MTQRDSVTVLVSGRGSNLKALIQHQSDYTVGHVVSDKADAGGLLIAKEAGIPTTVVDRASFSSLTAFKAGVLDAVKKSDPSVVALAGFMVLLQPDFIQAYNGRLLNIHPSLLPNFPGLHTHERALEAKSTQHGCTVHYVDAGMDTGPLIAQSAVPVMPGDSHETLSARVLTQEHILYPLIVRGVVQGDITLEGRTVRYSSAFVAVAEQLGLTLFA